MNIGFVSIAKLLQGTTFGKLYMENQEAELKKSGGNMSWYGSTYEWAVSSFQGISARLPNGR